MHDEGVNNLRCAIVERAAKDYLFLKKRYCKTKDDKYLRQLNRIIRFFRSEWYTNLIFSIDGETMLELLDKKFEDEDSRKIQSPLRQGYIKIGGM